MELQVRSYKIIESYRQKSILRLIKFGKNARKSFYLRDMKRSCITKLVTKEINQFTIGSEIIKFVLLLSTLREKYKLPGDESLKFNFEILLFDWTNFSLGRFFVKF